MAIDVNGRLSLSVSHVIYQQSVPRQSRPMIAEMGSSARKPRIAQADGWMAIKKGLLPLI